MGTYSCDINRVEGHVTLLLHSAEPMAEWKPLVASKGEHFTGRSGKSSDVAAEDYNEESDDEDFGEGLAAGVEEQGEIGNLAGDRVFERADAKEHGDQGDYSEGHIQYVRPPHHLGHYERGILDFFGDVNDRVAALGLSQRRCCRMEGIDKPNCSTTPRPLTHSRRCQHFPILHFQ